MGTILTLVLSNWKYVLVGMIVAGVVGGGVYKVEEWRMEKLKNKVHEQELQIMQFEKMVHDMDVLAKKAADTCSARLASKDELIKKLNAIDDMGVSNETNTGNPLRDALNGMYIDGK